MRLTLEAARENSPRLRADPRVRRENEKIPRAFSAEKKIIFAIFLSAKNRIPPRENAFFGAASE
jgi:hypothetical protein